MERQLEHGYALLKTGNVEAALDWMKALPAQDASSLPLLVFASEAHLANADPLSALDLIDKAVTTSGGHPALKMKKARLLIQMRRRAQVETLLADIAAQAGGNGGLLWQVGSLYANCNLFEQSLALYERARLLIGPVDGLLYDMAVSRFFTGDFEQAERDLDLMLTKTPQAGHALYLRATLKRQTREQNHVEDIEARLKLGFKEPHHEAAALYALSKELEDLSESERSFAALRAAAAKKRSTLDYDITVELASLAAVREAFTAEVMADGAAGHDGEGAIFIVGMPRTGTTLAERMLVQSGRAQSAGELLDFGRGLAMAARARMLADPSIPSTAVASISIDFAKLGQEYLRGAREAARGAPLFIDKMPINFLYCGMIRKALPKAKIIHLVRDPLDSCYAVLKTLFFNSYHFSYDLEELADYYIAYHEMMRHWHAVMPGQILDVHYEDLVTEPERESRRLFDWCGLQWDASVLETSTKKAAFATASAAQVREPVHRRSINSALKHREGLEPLIRKLAAAGIVSG
ncbi:MAG: sulfotransferase [Pseudomonadota bacterium]